jgi:hypothetical protein
MQTSRSAAMASPSVSFRISRSAEDLAGTLHLLSQRLVQLEQRLAGLEAHRDAAVEPESDPALDTSLANAERLLVDCRALLGGALDNTAAGSDSVQAAAHGPGMVEAVEAFDDEDRLEGPEPIAAYQDDGDDTVPLFQQDCFDQAVA